MSIRQKPLTDPDPGIGKTTKVFPAMEWLAVLRSHMLDKGEHGGAVIKKAATLSDTTFQLAILTSIPNRKMNTGGVRKLSPEENKT